jgi:putative PIN family toxin of toxin-antitoxin system
MSEKIIRIFIDTNVWFSSFYGSENCQKIIKAHQEEKITAIVSDLVIGEIVRNVKKKLPHQFDNLQKFLINTPPEIIPNPKNIPQKLISLISLKDLPIFVSATQAKVDYFITGNIKDFKIKRLEKITGIKILSPTAIVKLLKL